MARPILYILPLLLSLMAAPLHAGKIETNVTLSSYWVSNYKYFHAEKWVKLEGMTGDQWPTHKFVGYFRSDFVGPMAVAVDWNKVTKREHMSVRGMSWGQVDFGNGHGGPNKAWASRVESNGSLTPLRGIWYLYIDRDIRPGSYPKIQLMPQTRPANWYRGFKTSYYQVPFPIMDADTTRPKIVANNGDFLPMGALFKVAKLGTNVHNVPAINTFLAKHKFEVLDIGVGGRGLDVHLGLQNFEAEDLNKYSLWMPGSTVKDTRGATLDVLGKMRTDGQFEYWDANGKVIKVGAPPK